VEDSFIEMAKMALKRESSNQIFMPESISGAGGAIKLNLREESKTKTKVKKNGCC